MAAESGNANAYAFVGKVCMILYHKIELIPLVIPNLEIHHIISRK